MTTQEQDSLEALIDSRGLFAVLDALSGICGHKVEHIQTNWQDSNLAHEWDKAVVAIDRAASKVLDLNI